jgi:hypothetical protein
VKQSQVETEAKKRRITYFQWAVSLKQPHNTKLHLQSGTGGNDSMFQLWGEKQQNSLFVAGCVRDGNSYPTFITASICALVWVVRLWVNPTILDNELKCIIHETTIAALILSLVTVHQFLLRKRDQVICDYLIDSLHGPNCWEGPATPCRIAPSVTSSKPSRYSFCLRWKLYSCLQLSSHRSHRDGGIVTMMTK